MAVNTTPVSSDLILVVENGTGANGQTLSQSRRYGDVKPAALNDDIYSVAQSLSGLQSKPLIAVQRRDTVEIETA